MLGLWYKIKHSNYAKKIFILFSLFFLFSCSEASKNERHFANCVEDAKKTRGWSESGSVDACQHRIQTYPDEFKYYKGRVYSKKR